MVNDFDESFTMNRIFTLNSLPCFAWLLNNANLSPLQCLQSFQLFKKFCFDRLKIYGFSELILVNRIFLMMEGKCFKVGLIDMVYFLWIPFRCCIEEILGQKYVVFILRWIITFTLKVKWKCRTLWGCFYLVWKTQMKTLSKDKKLWFKIFKIN